MSKVVNLNRARKDRARAGKRARADENAAKSGRSKAERRRDETLAEQARQKLEGHKRDTPTDQ